MQPLILLLGAVSFALARPHDCAVVTTQVMQPTAIQTYLSTAIVTVYPTSARDLGTFTEVSTVLSTKDLLTITSKTRSCDRMHELVRHQQATTTVYTIGARLQTRMVSPDTTNGRRGASSAVNGDPDCTVTVTRTSAFGQTQTWIPADATSTFSAFTTFSQVTVTSSASAKMVFAIATAATVLTEACPALHVLERTVTISQDARCAPSAMISAHRGSGLNWQNDTPNGGAHWDTVTANPSQCCQLCAELSGCAASSWDARTHRCKLEFPVDRQTGDLDCGLGVLAFYDAGPDHPMQPGEGLFIAELCGHAEFAHGKPDDGT